MDPVYLIKLALAASVSIMVIGLGMQATFAEATSFFRHAFRPPYSLVRAIIAMNFVVPMVAALLAATFSLPTPVRVAIIAMSLSPVPPVIPVTQLKFGGRAGFVYGLLVAVSISALVFVPLSLTLLGRVFHRHYDIGFGNIVWIVCRTILVPLVVGLAIRSQAPRFADRWAIPVLRLGNGVLLAAILPVLVASWKVIVSLVGDGTVLAMTVMVCTAIAAGHRIGGPNEQDRTALGIVCAMRHPGVALAIATRNFPDEKLVPAAIVLFVLIAVLTTTVYGKLRVRRHRLAAAAVAS